MADTQTTTDHDAIKQWTDARDGVPARIDGTGDGKQDGLLRIHFPDESDDADSFERMGWGDFFEVFDDNDLAFLHSTDEDSTFCKFVER